MITTRTRRNGGPPSTRLLELRSAVERGNLRAKLLFDAGPGAVATEAALDELRVHNAELVVAEEELRRQLDELARATGRAEAERARYQTLFDCAPDAFFLTDRAGVVHKANLAASQLLAIAPALLEGKPLATFVHPEDARSFRDALSTLERGDAVQLGLRVRGRSGGATDGLFRGAYVHGKNRILWTVRSSGSLEDADALGKAEAELRRQRARNQELEARDRAKDSFLAVLSHDLRSPMSAILGWSQILREDALDDVRRERALAIIERNARAQLGLVEELLDLSRIGAGKLQLDFAPVELRSLLANAADAMHPAAAAAGVVLTTCLGDEKIVVEGDRRRLDQVVRNLLTNAIKFTPRDGKVSLTLDRSGSDAHVRVIDTGRGIGPSALPHIFEWLDQGVVGSGVGGGVEVSRGGLGLGLYIVRQLTEHHGGRVAATSRGVGEGAAFEVTLPVRSDAPAPSSSHDLHEPATDSLAGLRILLVEDDEDCREGMRLALQAKGGEVEAVPDAAAALAAFDARPPHVVVSDLGLPQVDGLELVTMLRQRFGRSAGAVAISGFASPRDASAALAAGFDACLAKPVPTAQLVEAILAANDTRSG